MENIKKYYRRYVQLIAAVLYNCNFTGFVTGKIYKGDTKGLCVPGLNCYSCPGAVFACPLGSLQGAIAKSAYKLPIYMLGTLLLFGIFFGRLICGFLCPFGLVQELLHKLPFPKIPKSNFTKALSYIKYAILAFFVVAIPLIKLMPGFCKFICPAGTIEAGIPLILMNGQLRDKIGPLFSWKVFILVLCILFCSVCYRAFCRFICPLGAIYSFFNPVAFFGFRVDKDKCTGCNACIHVCKMDVEKVGDHECIQCGECRKVCPEGAIGFCGKSGKASLHKEGGKNVG
ncbi:MAG: 4Fe-4S binding protein [Lachnospiraceae bacterium]|nr:4Fe-4S binding protein [Lachnospiraceae bacterium]